MLLISTHACYMYVSFASQVIRTLTSSSSWFPIIYYLRPGVLTHQWKWEPREQKKNSLEFPTMGWAFELRVVLVI